MKKLVIFALLFIVMLSSAVTFRWNPNSESDLAGYRIYWGTNSRSYVVIHDCGLTNVVSIDKTNFPINTDIYVSVTAYNTSGLESDHSNEVGFYVTNNSVVRIPLKVRGFRLKL